MLGLGLGLSTGNKNTSIKDMLGLKLFLEQQNITIPDIDSDGDTDIKWLDTSGNNNHATQSTDARQPTVSGNTLEFDGAANGTNSDRLDLTALITLTTFTIFMILDLENSNPTTEAVIGKSGDAANSIRINQGGTDNRVVLKSKGGDGGTVSLDATGLTENIPTAKFLFGITRGSDATTNNVEIYSNLTKITGTPNNSNSTSTLLINSLGFISTSLETEGFINEVVVFDRELDAAELTSVQQDIMKRHGL